MSVGEGIDKTELRREAVSGGAAGIAVHGWGRKPRRADNILCASSTWPAAFSAHRFNQNYHEPILYVGMAL